MARDELVFDLSDYRTTSQRIASLLPSYRRKLTSAMAKGARRGLHDALDEWKREATELAPLNKGVLRRGIYAEVSGHELNMKGELHAVAVESTASGRFNYAYYLQNVYPEKYGDTFRDPTTPGTIPRFIDKPAEDSQERWRRLVEEEIKAEMRAQGYRVR